MRYDLTVPLARFIASNPNLKMPFKRYAIGPVFRDGPIKLGRYREFTQCDVDIVGNISMSADAEMVKIALDAFARLGMDVIVKVNSRKVLDAIIEKAGVAKDKVETAILSIDKLEKFGKDAVEKELAGKGIGAAAIKKLMQSIDVKGTNTEKLDGIKKIIGSSDGIAEIWGFLKFSGGKKVEFEPSLARGLAYYTGTVFEVYLRGAEIASSVAAGGRYDKMIGSIVANNRDYPAVGISFGVDVISDALKLERKSSARTVAKAFVISIKQDEEASAVLDELRCSNISCDSDFSGKIGKGIEFANYYGIPYVIFVGQQEVKAKKYKVRDMKTGNEKMLSLKETAALLQSGSNK